MEFVFLQKNQISYAFLPCFKISAKIAQYNKLIRVSVSIECCILAVYLVVNEIYSNTGNILQMVLCFNTIHGNLFKNAISFFTNTYPYMIHVCDYLKLSALLKYHRT